jgi:hypothetical protein
MVKKALVLISIVFTVYSSHAQWKQKQFVIGTFADPRITYENNFKKDSISFALAKNAYINLLTGPQYYMGARDFSMMDRTLKLAEKFGMKLLVIDSRLRITDPSFDERTAKMIIDHFDSLNSKAFEGYYFGGEFPQKNAKTVNQWTAYFKKNDPDKLAYSYLLPHYAFSSKSKYEAYLNDFLNRKSKAGIPDVIAYDYYPFAKNGKILDSYFYNLELIREKAGSRPFWAYVLSTPTPNYADPTEYQLNFSTFCPIAYGARGIIYFTYETIPERYNLKYGDAIIDKYGNPTKKYYIVKGINEYIATTLGPVVMNSKYIGTFHATQATENETVTTSKVAGANALVQNISNENIMAGVFKSISSNERYIIFVNKKNAILSDIDITIKGNCVSTLKQYSRMGTKKGAVTKESIPANYRDGSTKFKIASMNPGEAILFEF